MAEEKAEEKAEVDSPAPEEVGFPVSGKESLQGRRWSMEDTCVVLDNLSRVDSINKTLPAPAAFYAVYDGHGGCDAALLLERVLHQELFRHPEFPDGNIATALQDTFLKVDEEMLPRSVSEGWKNGSTAVVAVLLGKELYIANVGDSEAVLAKKKSEATYVPQLLSIKHKPSTPEEKARIEKAGGQVIFGRVLGTLAVSRAFGDREFKLPYNKSKGHFVSSDPYIKKFELLEAAEAEKQQDFESSFLIVACDGLWDKMTYEDAVQFVGRLRDAGKSAQQSSELLAAKALNLGSLDNVTIVVTYLQ